MLCLPARGGVPSGVPSLCSRGAVSVPVCCRGRSWRIPAPGQRCPLRPSRFTRPALPVWAPNLPHAPRPPHDPPVSIFQLQGSGTQGDGGLEGRQSLGLPAGSGTPREPLCTPRVGVLLGRPQAPQSLAQGRRASISLHGERTALPACSWGGTSDSSALGGLGAPAEPCQPRCTRRRSSCGWCRGGRREGALGCCAPAGSGATPEQSGGSW